VVVSQSRPAPITEQAGRHFADLDGLRGVLALAVVLLHLGFNSFVERSFGWRGIRFELSVDVFFILSGYVLTHATRNGVEARVFLVRRFLRLAPVFYVTSCVTILAMPGSWHVSELALAAPMIGRDPANFPAWSVCWEFYLPALAIILPLRMPSAWVRPVLLLSLIALGIADIGVASGDRLYLVRSAFGLIAGHALYRACLTSTLPLLPLFGGLGLVMALAGYFPVVAILLPFIACLCIVSGCNGGSLFAAAPFQLLGHLSYTLYLAHIPVLRVMQHMFGTAVNANPLAKLAALAGTFIFAGILTVLVELPAIRLGRELGSRMRGAFPLGEARGGA
jgi:peptidoglycan/LPS O-acetylase OafA/YrhL